MWKAGHRVLVGTAVLTAVVFLLAPGIAAAAGPSNSSPPTISGTASAESTLTASPGQWSGATSYSYRFQRCNDTLTVCVPTGSSSLAQNPGAEREDTPAPLWEGYGATVTRDTAHGKSGGWSFKLTGDGMSSQQGLWTTFPSPATPGTQYTFSAWIYSAQPRSLRFGFEEYATQTSTTHFPVQEKQVDHPGGGWALLAQTVTTLSGTNAFRVYVDSYPSTAAYTIWLDDLELVKGGPGTSPSLPLSMSEAGSRIRVVVTATGAGGTTSTATSSATATVDERPRPTPIQPPSLSGDAWVGGTLSLSVGTWDDHGLPDQTGEGFQFERCDDRLVRCATTGANLLDDGDFESATPPWSGYGGSVARDTAHGKSGRWSLKVATAGHANDEGASLLAGKEAAVLPYHPYTFSVWVYAAQEKTFRIGFEELGTGGGWVGIQSGQQYHPGGGWALLSFTGTTGASTRLLSPFVDGWPTTGAYTIWLDNAELVHAIGATAPSFHPTSTSAGSRIRARVAGISHAGETIAYSNASAAIDETASTPTLPAPANSALPAISGPLTVGKTITLSPGTWSGSPSFIYRIERCGSSAASCAGTAVPNDLLNLGGSTVDPTFETTIGPWVGYGGVTPSRDGAHGKTGNWSMKLLGNGTSAPAGVRLPAAWPVDANNGHTYAFSAWVYSAAPQNIRMGFDQFETKGGPSLGAQSAMQYHPGAGWAFLGFTATTSPTTHFLNPFVEVPDAAPFSMWLENVVLADTSYGSTTAGYTIRPEDAGSRLRVVVTAKNANGSTTAISDVTGYVAEA